MRHRALILAMISYVILLLLSSGIIVSHAVVTMDQATFDRIVLQVDKQSSPSPRVIRRLEIEQDRLLSQRRLQGIVKSNANTNTNLNSPSIDVKKFKAVAARRVGGNTDPKKYFSVSPFNGTDIITHPISLIRCTNQTLCIQPQLQLQKHYNIYYCKHVSHGVRFYFLIRESLLLHPNLHFVDNPEAADVIVYLPESAVWHKTECADPKLKSKTIVLDETDGPQLFEPDTTDKNVPWLLYFKRSYVRRGNGVFKGYMGYLSNPAILPMTYTIAEAYVRPTFPTMAERVFDIVCTLRGGKRDPVRERVRQWVEEYGKARGVKKFVAGQVNHDSRTVVSVGYFQQMYSAKIVVTSNPSGWEGDFRLMEALASGALIFVDWMYVPRPRNLIQGEHIVYYDNMNKTDLFLKLDTYRSNMERARRVALAGYLHAMKYHRAANLADYVFRTLHTKELILAGASVFPYRQTGIDMRERALQGQKLYDERVKAGHGPKDGDYGRR